MGVISNGTTLLDAGALDSGVATGAMTLITSTTLSSAAANITFASGINSTYKEYQFHFTDIHPASNADFTVNFRDGSTAYDATKTTTFFHAQGNEAGDYTNLAYQTGNDVAQGTGVATIARKIGTGNDETCAGILHLFDPANTTFVKHFISRAFAYQNISAQYNADNFGAGYCNVTAAIDGVQFAMSSGNIDRGTIKMYGIK